MGLSRVLWEGVLGLSQSTLGGGFGPEPEYSGREFLGPSQSTLGECFGPKIEYSGREFLAQARVLWEGGFGCVVIIIAGAGMIIVSAVCSERRLETRDQVYSM